jgi:predicted nucleic acid-binding protein
MPAQGLIDTGAMLALLHRDDRWHARCVETFQRLRVPWATSVAVLTEFFYLASRGPLSVATTWEFVRSEAIVLLPIEGSDLPALDELMRKYADRPMDFADATLVHLARRESLTTVFTIDHHDFETYRIDGRRRFRIVPGR